MSIQVTGPTVGGSVESSEITWPLTVTQTPGTTDVLRTQVSGGGSDYAFIVNTDGKLEWGPQSGAVDTNLYRSAADTLKTDDTLIAGRSAGGAGVSIQAGGIANATRVLNIDDYGRMTHTFDNNGITDVLTLRNAGITAAGQGAGLNFTMGVSGSPLSAGRFDLLTDDTWAAAGNRDSYFLWQNALDGTVAEKMRLTSAGQLRLPITGIAGGILLGGDATIYRSAANVVATDHSFSALGGSSKFILGSSGARIQFSQSGHFQTTVGAAGGGSALPATPTKYVKILDNAGTEFVIPCYAAS